MTQSIYKIFIAVCFLFSAISAHQLNILGAVYGKANVTDIVMAAVEDNSLNIQASDEVFGDSWYGNKKSLVVVYQYANHKPLVAVASQDTYITITESDNTLDQWEGGDYENYENYENNENYENYENSENPETLEGSDDSVILGAIYGLADVTQEVQSLVEQDVTSISASNDVFGDSWYGNVKTLVIVYYDSQYNLSIEIVTEGDSFDTSVLASSSLPDLNVIKAVYGLGDVTNIVRGLVEEQGGKSLKVSASNSVFTDTWYGTQKALVIVYQYGEEEPQLAIQKENEGVSLSYEEQN